MPARAFRLVQERAAPPDRAGYQLADAERSPVDTLADDWIFAKAIVRARRGQKTDAIVSTGGTPGAGRWRHTVPRDRCA